MNGINNYFGLIDEALKEDFNLELFLYYFQNGN